MQLSPSQHSQRQLNVQDGIKIGRAEPQGDDITFVQIFRSEQYMHLKQTTGQQSIKPIYEDFLDALNTNVMSIKELEEENEALRGENESLLQELDDKEDEIEALRERLRAVERALGAGQ
ncbi:hypothetical protein G7Y89_g6520 [Cudoniella acicularis]|uniref:Uncharacterized protein n=1 Tax=Cudoniella acicularis TaxID=354080 RepID=A0A8H4RML2_9HELO|nr:hypothetical protein G7Y89_g6520 [Cudoniella acicularis]